VIGAGLFVARCHHSARNREVSPPSGDPLQPGLYGAGAHAEIPTSRGFLVELFHTLNNPADAEKTRRARRAVSPRPAIDKALKRRAEASMTIRIIRRMAQHDCQCAAHEFLSAGARTARPGPFFAMKLDSQKLEELPAPRPLVEIFVYSPEVEGVHLRFGKVGARWASAGRTRREDFRTEVLGLVKAQQVKNARDRARGRQGRLLSETASRQTRTRDEVQAAGISAYKRFINALLDVTDNLHPDGSIVPPPRLCAPTTSTIPISSSQQTRAPQPSPISPTASRKTVDFWLGDAFASGRQPRLRPQEDGHHRARRVGSGQAAFP